MANRKKQKKIVNIDEIINDPELQKKSMELYNVAGRLKEKHFIERFNV